MAERLATLVGIYALLGLGYQVVFGQLRALNLAQGALFGVGAYATALTAPHVGPFACSSRRSPRPQSRRWPRRRCCACNPTISRSPPWRSPR